MANTHRLVYTDADGREQDVTPGITLTDFRGDNWLVRSIERPRHDGSTGRIYAQSVEGWEQGFYPSVFGAAWVTR